MPSHGFVVMVARGCLWLTLVPAEAAPSPLGGDSERKITHVTSAWQWRTGANALRLVPVALWKRPSLNQREKGGLVTDSSPHVSIERFVAYLLKGAPLTPEDQAHMGRCYV
jgi:hypothetical protein